MINDRVGDFIIRLQNAARAGQSEVRAPYSRFIFSLAKKLKELGFLSAVEEKESPAAPLNKTIVVELARNERGTALLRGVRRLSKPGRRQYVPHTKAHTVAGGTGARILSTSAGVLSDAQARRARVGGEELFEIW